MNPVSRLSDRIERWRTDNWPPRNLRQYGDLNIYTGNHEAVMAFAEPLAEIMGKASTHVMEVCRGRIPRWMAFPKVVFNVERVNITSATAQASKRFSTIAKLVDKCGSFKDGELAKLEQWKQMYPDGVLVAHRPFHDVRAYVYVKGKPLAQRLRFTESGLVVADAGCKIHFNDHRKTIRDKRSDAFVDPIASNYEWKIFAARI